MYKVLIIEDEKPAAEWLSQLIRKFDDQISILAQVDSVRGAEEWFQKNAAPDLVFMDIQLADGLSFEIFERVKVPCPVIFTTAYQEYAIKAFKVNSIDYLLKPISWDDLQAAFLKFKGQTASAPTPTTITIEILDKVKEMMKKQYKTRFVIKVGDHLKSIPVEEILFFYSLEKGTYLCTNDFKNYLIDYPLERISEMVDEQRFFRINRKYILSNQSIADIVVYSNSRLKIKLKKPDEDNIIVSREKVQDFKDWLDR
ncbi:MAG TPA: LytTR family DNA-binding domain-containing protein [Prolixibacteraceae bacterium]|nr:LytTR family DNA-binding domain-containing protein [Prolixibacteraceae bacterium]